MKVYSASDNPGTDWNTRAKACANKCKYHDTKGRFAGFVLRRTGGLVGECWCEEYRTNGINKCVAPNGAQSNKGGNNYWSRFDFAPTLPPPGGRGRRRPSGPKSGPSPPAARAPRPPTKRWIFLVGLHQLKVTFGEFVKRSNILTYTFSLVTTGKMYS